MPSLTRRAERRLSQERRRAYRRQLAQKARAARRRIDHNHHRLPGPVHTVFEPLARP